MEDEHDAPEGLPVEFKAAWYAGEEAGRLRAEQSRAWLRALDQDDVQRAQTLADCVARSIGLSGLEIEPLTVELRKTLEIDAGQAEKLATAIFDKFDAAAPEYCATFLGTTHFEAAYVLAGYEHPRLEEDVENELGMLEDAVAASRAHHAQLGMELRLSRYFRERRKELQEELAYLRAGGRPVMRKPKLYVTKEDIARSALILEDEPDSE